jgi:hypothetical protein
LVGTPDPRIVGSPEDVYDEDRLTDHPQPARKALAGWGEHVTDAEYHGRNRSSKDAEANTWGQRLGGLGDGVRLHGHQLRPRTASRASR